MNEEQQQEYNAAVDEASQAAGSDDGLWNMRFIAELYKRNLRLARVSKVTATGTHIYAPKPVEGELPTWSQCLIIPFER